MTKKYFRKNLQCDIHKLQFTEKEKTRFCIVKVASSFTFSYGGLAT